MGFRKMTVWSAAVVLGVTVCAQAAVDNFDAFTDGDNLIGASTGNLSYVNGSRNGSLGVTDYFIATNSDSVSPSNSAELHDGDAGAGGITAQLNAAGAVDLSAISSSTVISFDFKTTSGGTSARVNASILPLYSTDANGTSQHWVNTAHIAGMSSNGKYWLNNGSVVGPNINVNRYQANTWYNFKLDIARTVAGFYDYTLTLTRVSDSFLFDTFSNNGIADGGRSFLTGVQIELGSLENETILIDNLTVGVVPEPASLGLLGVGAMVLLRRKH